MTTNGSGVTRHRAPGAAGSRSGLGALLLAATLLVPSAAHALNPIQTENALPGTPASTWDVSGAGDPSIQGFATDISVNRGSTVHFKIRTGADSYHIDIYRLGWYGGLGARLMPTPGVISATLPQLQPDSVTDATTGLVDCGNWAESAHWDVPADAVSGIYIARLERDDTHGASHVAFIVRDDASTASLLFKTSDATWQAYNVYGGNSLYVGSTSFPGGHAAKVSYNRPFSTRGGGGGGGASEDWLFNSEYPMVRWLESNGYDMSYTTDLDTDRDPTRLLQHHVFMSVGHDEYWSAGERAAVETARDAGIHLAFFSGNESYWKTRWEPSIDGSSTPYRTLVCYKEGTLGENVCGGKCDPLTGVWTGLWRDGCNYTPATDGCRPENALSGQISWLGTTDAITVPDTYKTLRFWRNTAVASLAPATSLTLTPGTLGYEWDFEQYPASYPPGRIQMSSTTNSGQVHHLSLYRAPSGALVFGAGTVQWSWGLDATHDRGSDPPTLAMQQATVNLLADMGVQPGGPLQAGLVPAVASTDGQAPISIITAPLQGASLPSGVPVTISGTASDVGGGVLVGVDVSTDGGATWHPATGTASWSYSWTPSALGSVTLMSRGFDDSGNLESTTGEGLTNVISVTVTTAPPPTCPCTAWDPSVVPGNQDGGDGTANELGVRFRVDNDGFISGVRFWKSTLNTGTHVGNLYTNTGTPLATAIFTGESATGWQEVSFPSPVPVTGGTTYVASVWMPSGHYAYGAGFFASAGVDRPPVHLLQNGVDGANGIYHAAAQGFPTATFGSANYWVDAVYNTTGGPDTTPPVVATVSPANGATTVPVGASVTATFNEPMTAATIGSSTFELRTAANALVPATVAYNSGAQTATLTPASPLDYSSTYTARVTTGVKDAAGNAMAADDTWSFTTIPVPPPPPTEGPGGPILVISSAANPFSRYPVEILRNEGFNAFTAMDLSLVTPAVLSSYDVVVLGQCALGASDVSNLTDWTNAGGTLIAFRPDPQLAPLLGLTPASGTLTNGYLLVNTATGPGVGIYGQTMQFHGTADEYTPSGASSVATLYSDAATATPYPAVTTRNVGSSGGRAIAFTYDLARSVVYTRQGNPAWAGTKRDGQIEPIRSDDQFFGNAAGDPQPDWIDFNRIAVPQADEQQRLLANAIVQGDLHRKPLPRFWYLPKGLKAAIVMTGDNHGDSGMAPRFDIYRNQSAAGCSVDDWECVRATGYLYVGSTFTPAQATFYKSLGFEVSLHINTNCARATPSEYEGFVSSQSAAFNALYPDIALVTNRNHCIAWSDWSSVPEIESAHGIRLDTNYYYWPPTWVADRPGFFTGSGMPMRFAKLDGTIIDCYQAVTQMPDESGESFPAFCDALLDKAQGPEGFYGVFTTNMHFDTSPHPGSDAVVASAQAHNVPVVSAQQMLTWLDGRNGSSFSGLTWSGNLLSFTIAAAAGSRNLQAMVPAVSAVGPLHELRLNGSPVATTTQTIKGIAYAFFPAAAGSYVVDYTPDTTPPVISAVADVLNADGTATVTWTTDEPSDSHVNYGTDPNNLSSTAGSSTLVTSHSVTLTGLATATTYSFRVRSADAVGNSATSPAPPAPPLGFTTPNAPCAQDQTAADFAQGATGAGTVVTQAGDGEVTLAPALSADFTGTSLPPGFSSGLWVGGGNATVAGGLLTVDGAEAWSQTSYTSGHSLEFVATFRNDTFQNVGFAANSGFGPPWVTFGTGASAGGVYARASDNSADVLIPGVAPGTPHRYRIDWTATDFTFFVDGAQVAQKAFAVAQSLIPIASDVHADALGLDVDWLRLEPYASAGSYTSRVFDSVGPTTWGAATWTATVPAGTSLTLYQRQGGTPTPDGTWGAFAAIATNGAAVGGTGRYLQYRADLTSSLPTATPVLDAVQFACSHVTDTTPPVISAVVATPGPSGTTAHIEWTTDEPATSAVDYGTSATALGTTASSPVLAIMHAVDLASLSPGTTYYFRARSADASNNSATSPAPPSAPLSFVTPAAPPSVCAHDQTVADFSAGTLSGTAITQTGDGEVALAPSLDEEFSGTSLPTGWSTYDWPFDNVPGSFSVAGGLLTLDGMRANPDPFAASPGASLEFVATFSGDANQHVGFGGGSQLPPGEVFDTQPWAIFSTIGGGGIYARTNLNGTMDDAFVSAGLLGAPHRYRIDWHANSVDFSVDGTPVHTSNVTIAGPMRPAASDLTQGGGVLTVDWMHMTPYVSPGTFVSRVFDAGTPVAWSTLSWNATTPTGTSVALEVRRGGTPVPDGTWTPFTAVAGSGGSIAGVSQYLQYRAALTSSDLTQTPSLLDVSASCLPCPAQGPAAIADLAVSRQSSGGTPGRLPIAVTFTAPSGAATIEVYRAPFGGYPRYDKAGGVLPTTPSYPPPAPWTLTAVTASGQTDLPPARDQWHYVAFARNACGLASAVSNRPTGVLDYRLGDVTDGVTICAGDDAVGTADVTLLGAHYGETLAGTEDYACLDVGPTTDSYVTGRPLTDGHLDFEDLLMFAIEYATTGGARPAAATPLAAASADAVVVDAPAHVLAGQTFDVTVRMDGAARLQGVSLRLAWDAVVASPVRMTSGGWLEGQGGVVYSPRPGAADAALLGRRAGGIAGSGTLAVFTFRALADGSPAISLASLQARDPSNRAVSLGTLATAPPRPTVTALDRVMPNPFADRASIRFSLSQDGPVDLTLFSVDGRLVRTLVRGMLPAGTHTFDWNRENEQGSRVGPGLYLVRLTTAQGRFTHKLSVVR